MRTLRALAAAPALCLTSLAGAQTPEPAAPADSARRLPPIEVIGSIVPTAAPEIGSGVPARISVVTGREIDAWEPRLLADALARQPGISAYDDLGSPFKLTLTSRGFTSSPVVGLPQGISVFLDGVPVNEPDAAQVNFDLLPLEHISRLELLSGTSALLGPNSLGGAVNLVTRRGSGATRGELEVSAGSYGLYSAEASLGGGRDAWSWYVGGGYDHDDGWRDVTGARQYNGFVNLGRLGERAGVSVQLFGAQSRAETAGSLPESVFEFRPDSNLSAQDFEDLDQLHGAVSAYRVLGRGRGSLNVYYRRHDAERFNVNQPADPDVRSFSENRTAGANLDYRIAAPALGGAAGLRVGASGSTNDVMVRILADLTKFGRADSLTTVVESPIARLGVYAIGDVTYGAVTLSLGGRWDRVRVPFRNRLNPARDTTSTFDRFSPKGGVSVALGRRARAYASVGQSFRAPAVIELACADPQEPCPLPFALGDDPPLDPVVATSAELGGQLLIGSALLSGSVYRTNVRDDIFLFPYEEAEGEPEGSTIDGYFSNVSRTRREGVELAGSMELPRGISLFANYAYTRATFQTGDLDIFSIRAEGGEDDDGEEEVNQVAKGDRLPLIPAHTFRAGVDARLPRGFEVGADVRHTGEQWLRGDEANETSPLDAFTVVNARLGYTLRGWGVQAIVYNVLDDEHATFGTFNLNQGAGDRLERFLTPGQPRIFRLVVRRALGAAGDVDD
jgi:outer membrane receptor protein involved in Fe transport